MKIALLPDVPVRAAFGIRPGNVTSSQNTCWETGATTTTLPAPALAGCGLRSIYCN